MKNNHTNAEPAPAESQTTDTTIFYYSGTGNSLWIARALARELGNAEVVSMVGWANKRHIIKSRRIGLVFPVHIWGVPGRVLEFLDQLPAKDAGYIFAVASNGGQVANTLVQLAVFCKNFFTKVASYFSIVLQLHFPQCCKL